MQKVKRVSLFSGHYGSGKTNLAVNYAIYLKRLGKNVAIYDMDIVNPYYRTVDGKQVLEQEGVRLIASSYANTNVDLPAMPAEMYSIADELDRYAVADIGGDDRGALALGRFSAKLKAENNYDMIYVVNKYRFETRTPEEALVVLREIELAGKIPFTSIINNSNLGAETTAEDVIKSFDYADRLSALSGLPVTHTAVREDLVNKITTDRKPFPIKLVNYDKWK